MNKLGVIIAEVYRKNVKSGAFIFMVLGPLFFIGVFGVIGYFIGQESMGEKDVPIAVVTDSVQVKDTLKNVTSPELVEVDSLEQAQKELADKKVEGYLHVGEDNGVISATFYSETTNKKVNLQEVTQALSSLQLSIISQALNLNDNEITQVQNSQVTVNSQEVSFDSEGKIITAANQQEVEKQKVERFIKIGMAYVVSILIFMFIMNYAGIIAQEIASEKGTRIMEIILSSVSATTHFFGKMIGITLVLLTQLLIYFVLGLIAWNIPMVQSLKNQFIPQIELGSIVGPVLFYGILFFIFGVILYVSISAFFGSLITKAEDVSKAASPIAFLGIIGFYVGMYALNNPNSPLVVSLSYVPLWTPFIMPFRIAADTVSNNQILVSVAVLVLGTVLITWLSLVFYRSNVLVYSDANMLNVFKRSLGILKSETRKKK